MTAARSAALQHFLDATEAAIAARVGPDTPAALAMRRVNASLARPAPSNARPPGELPACRHLSAAIANARGGAADLARLADAIGALAPGFAWRRRDGGDAIFAAGHANADVLGPDPLALEKRDDVRLGISLLAPNVTYPDHRHPPEEVYIVLSAGDWRQNAEPWHTPGLGGIVYNPPDIVHAMRSGPEPLLAVWCLPV